MGRLTTIDDIYLLELAKLTYQINLKKLETALNDCFVDIIQIRSHNTRTKHDIVYFKPRVQTSAGKKFLTLKELICGEKSNRQSKNYLGYHSKKKIKQKAIQSENNFDLLCSIFWKSII